jgi:hypothetical protein
MRNNLHEEAPIYKQSAHVETKTLESVQHVETLFAELRPQVRSHDRKALLSAIGQMEAYLLNIENLRNPAINTRGSLHPAFNRLMNLYGYAMSYVIRHFPVTGSIRTHLDKFRATIFSNCDLENVQCETTAAFKGAYSVSLLAYLIDEDIERLEGIEAEKRIGIQAIKNIVFSLYVLKYFNETESTLTENMFIRFSSLFFNHVNLSRVEDPLLNRYLVDLQNMMVRLSREEVGPESCSLFQNLSREKFNSITQSLDRSFVTQFNNHYYRCHEPEQIIARILADEEIQKIEAEQEVRSRGFWSEYRNGIHGRLFTVVEELRPVLNNFSVRTNISPATAYLMDQIYYGEMRIVEREALLSRLSNENLEEFVERVEDYAKINFIYNMHYTFKAFNSALRNHYAESGAINTDFVQNVYDELWETIGDKWRNYKVRVSRLKSGLNDVYFRLPADRRERLREIFDRVDKDKLTDQNIVRMIDLTVTYPIVLATTYFTGVDGGATMEIRIGWIRGSDNTVEISTRKPLMNYFQALQRSILQLLDFGSRSYQPYRYERSLGLAAAIKTGFFDSVNLSLGEDSQGMQHNLMLFWKRYVEHNRGSAETAQRQMEDLREMEDNHWYKVKRFCDFPIAGVRRIQMHHIYQDFYLDSQEGGGNVGNKDLDFVTRINGLQTHIDNLDKEINSMRRTYQVIVSTLQELGHDTTEVKTIMGQEIVPHLRTLRQITDKRDQLQRDVYRSNESCLHTLNKMQRFQQNLMQRQAVDYAAKVHAAMSVTRTESELFRAAADLTKENSVTVIKDKARVQLNQNWDRDSYESWVFEQLANTQVLDQLATERELAGQELLLEAVNLLLAPHNLRSADFGTPVTGLDRQARNLSDLDNLLNRRGGIEGDFFEVSNQDQRLRAREEILNLSAPAWQVVQYFSQTPSILRELRETGFFPLNSTNRNREVSLNPNLTIFINDLQYFKDRRGRAEKRGRVEYVANREIFVRDLVEVLFGSAEQGQQIFNWSTEHTQISYLNENYNKNLENYKRGPIFIPRDLEDDTMDLSCLLDLSFDRMHTDANCRVVEVQAPQIIDEFIERSEFLHLGEHELFPIVIRDESGAMDELSELSLLTLLNSYYIANYKPKQILHYFEFYKKEEDPHLWTWFDAYLSGSFTTQFVRDQNHQLVANHYIPGVYQYQVFDEERDDLQLDRFLLELPKSTEGIFRRYFRAPVINSIELTENIIAEMRRREYETVAEDWPEIRYRREDTASRDVNEDNARDWLTLSLNQRDNGSLLLLGDGPNYQLETYGAEQVAEFRKFDADLLPIEGDVDFSLELFDYYNSARINDVKTRRWYNFRRCQQIQEMQERYEDYHEECVPGLRGE